MTSPRPLLPVARPRLPPPASILPYLRQIDANAWSGPMPAGDCPIAVSLHALGIDISPYLIELAQERFARGPHGFLVGDAATFAETHQAPSRFTRALCYGNLSYFSDDGVERRLRALHARFPNLRRLMLGNLPDPALAGRFCTGPVPDLREPHSDVGVWRRLAGPGWALQPQLMPDTFFAAHYRFDALLVRTQ